MLKNRMIVLGLFSLLLINGVVAADVVMKSTLDKDGTTIQRFYVKDKEVASQIVRGASTTARGGVYSRWYSP